MIVTCEFCHGQRNVTPLSAPRRLCAECGEPICPDCEYGRCRRCDAMMHARCGCAVGEDYYCEACGEPVRKQLLLDELSELPVSELQAISALAKIKFLRTATIEELLAASETIAAMRKSRVKMGVTA